MKKEELSFNSFNGKTLIRAMRYIPEGEVKAILQIAHGMVEFIDRYESFAEYLCSKGILVTGNDHLGHGGSVESRDDWGYFGDNGNEILIEDMYSLTKLTKEQYPDKPYFLLGHSMGSFYARQYLTCHGDELTGAIIMGTGMEDLNKIKAGMFLCKLMASIKGWRYRSSFVNNMSFGAYNKKFEPARTKVDWLTKDESIVDWYLKEPRCTFAFTLNGYYQMFKGISSLYDKEKLNRIPKQLPVFFVSGKDDPVGSFGKEVEKSVESLKEAGIENIKLKLYPDDRHEILNETDKEVVYQDIYDWLVENM